ncbi:MAG: transcription antitermination factor NusB [Parvularculaceae bacterium]
MSEFRRNPKGPARGGRGPGPAGGKARGPSDRGPNDRGPRDFGPRDAKPQRGGDRSDKEPAKEPPPPGYLPRRAALDILILVAGGRTLDTALAECRSFNALEGPDRGLAHSLAANVLRRRGSIDHVIGKFIDRPLPKRAARATDIIRLAAAQSLILKTPDHAAVSLAVALAKDFRETAGYAALINAVARKIAKAGPAAIENLPERIDTPGWMWRGWERAFGAEGARAIAKANAAEAPIDLTLREPADAPAFAAEIGATLLPTGSVRVAPGTRIDALPGFEEGRFWAQDAAAALPAKLLGDVRGKRVFDLCAAPGGKTMQLAAAGAQIVAVDEAGERLKLVADNLARTKLTAETIKFDILKWTPFEKADAILLDAPCTATGTIRRHPDIPWAKNEDDVKALAALQAKMIDHAVDLLNPGGVLVYCVCSLQPEEGERQAASALKRRSDLKRIPIEPGEIGGLAALTRDGDLRTLPSMLGDQGGMDGFFAVRFRRN